MNIAAERKAIDVALDAYRAALDRLPDTLFDATPSQGGWSLAEVYSHILQGTLGSSIALEKCTLSTCPPSNKGINWFGRLLFLLGQFPPVKIKSPQYNDGRPGVQKIDKETARNLIIKCRQRIDTVTPLVQKSVKNRRTAHPRLGMLNAKQWLRFIRIHLQHHLKQLQRIEKSFA